MPLVKGRVALFMGVVVGILRSRAAGEIVGKVRESMGPGIADLKTETIRETAACAYLQRVVAGVAIVGGVLQKGVLTRARNG